jgi:hypothetical protein
MTTSTLDTTGASMLSRERLLQAREFYAPAEATAPPAAALERWARRLSTLDELSCARELGGLSNDELGVLETEFARCQLRPRNDRLRQAVPAGLSIAAVGVALMALGMGSVGDGQRIVVTIAAGIIVLGVVLAACGLVKAFGLVHLDLAWGTTGLYVGRLDEQHPWLYKAMAATRHPAAEAYRQEVLKRRGPLRGLDCVLMRELVRAHDAVESTRFARSVAEQLQRPAPTAMLEGPESRIVRIRSKVPAMR